MIPDDHMPFLRAIVEHPDDAAPKLVYADFLDERGESAAADGMRAVAGCAAKESANYPGEWFWSRLRPGPRLANEIDVIVYDLLSPTHRSPPNELADQMFAYYPTAEAAWYDLGRAYERLAGVEV